MKIYPSRGNIVATKTINPKTDIALSYIDTSHSEYKVSMATKENLRIDEKKEILPYDKVKEIMCLFYDNGIQIPFDEMIKSFVRDKDSYMYVPYGSTIFSPKTFEYTVTGKRTMEIKSNKPYNMRISVMNNMKMAKAIMPIFGDAQNRGVSPSNISVNGADLSLQSLTSIRLKDADITLLSMSNLNSVLEDDYFDGGQIENPFDESMYLSNSTVSMIGFVSDSALTDEDLADVNQTSPSFVKLKEKVKFKNKKDKVYSNIEVVTDKVFTIPTVAEDGVRYFSLFSNPTHTPVLIKEYEGRGMLVYISDSMIKNPTENSKFLYEILAHVFSISYLRTDKISDWISDKIPDYIVENKKLIKKEFFTSSMELHKMFSLDVDDIIPYSVDINKVLYPFVEFTGVDKNFLRFKKNIDGDNSQYSDPIQKEGSMSIFTANKNIIYYDKFIYSIKSDIEKRINTNINENTVQVNIKSYKNSELGINITTDKTTLEIPLYVLNGNDEVNIINSSHYIVSASNGSASYYAVIEKNKYKESDGHILTEINTEQVNSRKLVYDMRQRGGGLPEEDEDVFDCFDIGHILGKPYRKAGSLIITLPLFLEKHDAIIQSAIKQYMSAEDLPIIIYKGE